MEAFEDCCWNELDYCIIDNSSDFYWSFSSGAAITDGSSVSNASADKLPKRKREQKVTSCPGESKAAREKLRREKINDRFLELNSVLHPGRPAKTDKSAILTDAICTLENLRTEADKLKEKQNKLQEEIKSLKAEKNKLRQEKLQLTESKEKIEQQIQTMTVTPSGFPPMKTAIYHSEPSKVIAFPSYSGFPMWQWISPVALDTSQDHVLRPPVA